MDKAEIDPPADANLRMLEVARQLEKRAAQMHYDAGKAKAGGKFANVAELEAYFQDLEEWLEEMMGPVWMMHKNDQYQLWLDQQQEERNDGQD